MSGETRHICAVSRFVKKGMGMPGTLEQLRQSLLDYDSDACEEAARKAVETDVDPVEAFTILAETLREIGEKFRAQEIFLMDLMMAGDASKAAMAVLRKKNRQESKLRTKA